MKKWNYRSGQIGYIAARYPKAITTQYSFLFSVSLVAVMMKQFGQGFSIGLPALYPFDKIKNRS
jgi:hypothetical protein